MFSALKRSFFLGGGGHSENQLQLNVTSAIEGK